MHKYTSKYKNLQRRQGVARGVKCLAQIHHDPYNQSFGAGFGCSCFGEFGFFFSLSWQTIKPSDEIRGEIETRKNPLPSHVNEKEINTRLLLVMVNIRSRIEVFLPNC